MMRQDNAKRGRPASEVPVEGAHAVLCVCPLAREAADATGRAAAKAAAKAELRAQLRVAMVKTKKQKAEAEANAERAAAELLAAEEATMADAATAAAKKRKKKKKKKKNAPPKPTTDAPPTDAVTTKAAAPSPAKPAADDPPDEITALLRRLGLEERVGPIFAREQIEEESLPFITIEDLVEVGVSSVDAQTIVAAVTPDAEPTAVATEPAAAFKEAPAAEIPERLCCPISMDIMAQPVLAADGHTYDRSSIEDWLSRGNTTSPTTGAPLEHLALAPNHLVKSMVAENKDSVASR